ncbi:MAG: hypothetical protein IT242_07860 [Bacteroidia bacterium]|nr:hypothetical protein [Bacteroidia bacterium]
MTGCLSSCKYFERKKERPDDAIARTFQYYLFPSDIKGLIPAGTSPSDSLVIVRNFIDNWIRQKAVLHKAENNLDDEKKDVEKKLDEYRNSLITYAYESELIRQKLDTVVPDEEIEEYYKTNRNNFELKNNILRVIYLKTSKKSPKLDKVRNWYGSANMKDRAALQEYCRQYATNYFLDDTTWLLFDDLLKEIPIKTYDKEQFLQNNRNIEIEDSTMVYFVSIKGFMIKNSISPLSFEKNNIRSLIINQRKLKLIERMEQEAYEEALNSGNSERY